MKDNRYYKKIFICIVASVCVILVAAAIFVFCFDPFFHYHKPFANVKVSFENEAYQNPGIARNFDYDSVIVGSSMTRLFKASDFDAAFDCNAVQVPYSGGTIKNSAIILDQVFNHHTNNKYVFWGLDIYALGSNKNEIKQELPEYMYDDNMFSDVSYLFNKSVYEQIFMNQIRGQRLDYDLMWDDEKDDVFCQANAIKDQNINTGFEYVSLDNTNYHEIPVPNNVKDNVEENIIPFVKDNSDVRFVFFIPTYSVIYWNSGGLIYGRMPELIAEMNYVYEKLSEFENTEFHVLSLMPETSNLYLYKDSLHNNYALAKRVPEALISKKYMVTELNREEIFNDFYEYVMKFNYGVYTGEEYTFQNEMNFSAYFDMIEDERFTKFVIVSSKYGNLNDDEVIKMKSKKLLPEDYSGEDYFNIIGNKERFVVVPEEDINITSKDVYAGDGKTVVEYSIASDNSETSVKIDEIEYVVDPKVMMILVYDNETDRVVDVAGLRSDTRELEKY